MKKPYETTQIDGVTYAVLQETFGAKKIRYAHVNDGEPYDEKTPINRLCSAGQMLRTGKFKAVSIPKTDEVN